jgi:hypothetical protein
MPKAASTKTKAPSKKGRAKTTGEEEPIDVDSPPPTKKQRATSTRFFMDPPRGFTINPYVQETKNKIDVILHKCGVPRRMHNPK